MPTAHVEITECIQDMQDIGTEKNDSVMSSRIGFSLTIDGRLYDNLYVVVSQPYGTDYATEPLEVSRPIGYDGPFSHHAFSKEVEAYYRRLVGNSGAAISTGGTTGIRMRNNRFIRRHAFSIEVDSSGGAGW